VPLGLDHEGIGRLVAQPLVVELADLLARAPIPELEVKGRVSRRDMRREYRFDYAKARPSRFAAALKGGTTAVVLDPDVASVFESSEPVNRLLRSVIGTACGREAGSTARLTGTETEVRPEAERRRVALETTPARDTVQPAPAKYSRLRRAILRDVNQTKEEPRRDKWGGGLAGRFPDARGSRGLHGEDAILRDRLS
jgi:hypothetical protein